MLGAVVEKYFSNIATPRFATDFTAKKLIAGVFTFYLIILAITVSHHEPWMDEAQAWLLAKDAGVVELFTKYLKYEGSPGLWHLILMIPTKLGLPYASLNIISAFFSAVGAWLFMRYSPFPTVIKLLFPFTYFAFFQYGVVARNYCLIPAILFLVAITYKTKMDRPLQYSFLLCLLANISAHTFLMAGCFLFLHFIEVIRSWKTLGMKTRIRNAVGFSMFGSMGILTILILLPPQDHIFANLANSTTDNTLKVVARMIGGSLTVDEFSNVYWIEALVCLAVFIVSIVWFTKRRVAFLYLLPLIVICVLFALKYRNFWHQGVLFFLWIFVFWVSLENIKKEELDVSRRINSIVGIVIAIQVYWSTHAIIYDIYTKYSASYSVAQYLKGNGLDKKKIFISGWKSLSILPYFDEKIFYNYNQGSKLRFWSWSRNNLTPVGADKRVINTIVKDQPDVVIFASHYIPRKKKIKIVGYEVVGTFKGFLCWKTGVLEPESFLVFRKYNAKDSSLNNEADQKKLLKQKSSLGRSL